MVRVGGRRRGSGGKRSGLTTRRRPKWIEGCNGPGVVTGACRSDKAAAVVQLHLGPLQKHRGHSNHKRTTHNKSLTDVDGQNCQRAASGRTQSVHSDCKQPRSIDGESLHMSRQGSKRLHPTCTWGRGVTAAQQTFNLHGEGSNPSDLTPAVSAQVGQRTDRARSSMVRAGSL